LIRNLLHIILAFVVTVAPPGASMIEYSCELTGDAQVLSTLGAGSHVDECCTDEADATALADADGCCSTTVYSLPKTSAAPAQRDGHATLVLVAIDFRAPDMPVRLSGIRASMRDSARVSRNLPLLV
jgi:hypothetical protein